MVTIPRTDDAPAADFPALLEAAAPGASAADEVEDPTIEYPSWDGEPVAETEKQYLPMTHTVAALRYRYRHRDDVYVIGDMLVYYRMNCNDIRVAPDVFVVFGAIGNHPRDSWLVWREGKAPDFVLEIASQGTWRRDLNEKRVLYALLGVKEYWCFDPTGACYTPALIAEVLNPETRRYEPLPVVSDPSGELRCFSPLLGVEFRVEAGLQLRIYDPETGERLRTLEESEELLRAETEARREAEGTIILANAARADAEAAAIQADAARADAEAQIQALQEEIRRLWEQE